MRELSDWRENARVRFKNTIYFVGYICRDILLFYYVHLVQGPNLALGKPAQQSTTLYHQYTGHARLAVDGNTNRVYTGGSCSHTQEGLSRQWWAVDLQGQYTISRVVIHNRVAHGEYEN